VFTRITYAILMAFFAMTFCAQGQSGPKANRNQKTFDWSVKTEKVKRKPVGTRKKRNVDRPPPQEVEEPPEKIVRKEIAYGIPKEGWKRWVVIGGIASLAFCLFLFLLSLRIMSSDGVEFEAITIVHERPHLPPSLWQQIRNRIRNFYSIYSQAQVAWETLVQFRQHGGNEMDQKLTWNELSTPPEKRIIVNLLGDGGAGCNVVTGIALSVEERIKLFEECGLTDLANEIRSHIAVTLVDTCEGAMDLCGAKMAHCRFYMQRVILGKKSVTEGKGSGKSPKKARRALIESQPELNGKFLRFRGALHMAYGSGGKATSVATFIPIVRGLKNASQSVLATYIRPTRGEVGERQYKIAEEMVARLSEILGICEILNEGAYIDTTQGPDKMYDSFNKYLANALVGFVLAIATLGEMDHSDFLDNFAPPGARYSLSSASIDLEEYQANPGVLFSTLDECLDKLPAFINYSGQDGAIFLAISASLPSNIIGQLRGSCTDYLAFKRPGAKPFVTWVPGLTNEVGLSMIRSNATRPEEFELEDYDLSFKMDYVKDTPEPAPVAAAPTARPTRTRPRRPRKAEAVTHSEPPAPAEVTEPAPTHEDVPAVQPMPAPALSTDTIPPAEPAPAPVSAPEHYTNGHAAGQTSAPADKTETIAAATNGVTVESMHAAEAASNGQAASSAATAVAAARLPASDAADVRRKMSEIPSLIRLFAAAETPTHVHHKEAVDWLENKNPDDLPFPLTTDKPNILVLRITGYKKLGKTLKAHWTEACVTALRNSGVRFRPVIAAGGRTIFFSDSLQALTEHKNALSENPEYDDVRKEIELRIGVIRALGQEYLERFKPEDGKPAISTPSERSRFGRAWSVMGRGLVRGNEALQSIFGNNSKSY
jgi:cell division GTPase FtsZ